ncbi:MAG: alanyl-tRNA editing protein [Rhodospirillales bacterium]
MTEALFREDAYLRDCKAKVVASGPAGIELDRSVFYPEGGGQPGDSGRLRLDDGRVVEIANTRKGESADGILHIPAEEGLVLEPGTPVVAEIDWERRHRHMRMHTAMHLLCGLVEGDVTGGQVGAEKSRLDFNLPDGPPDKAELQAALNALVAADHRVAPRWIDEAELDANPDLVRTLSVKPPRGSGRVRLLEIAGVDLQPCGGTHVRSTAEVGALTLGKIENKGRQNRRFNLRLAD